MMETSAHPLDEMLQQAAAAFQYPDTPDLNIPLPAAQARILRPAFGWVATVILLISLSIAVPTVRAAVWERLTIGVVEILLGGQADRGGLERTQPATLAVLGDPVSLDEAQEGVEFPLLLPRYPDTLGLPDAAYLQYPGGSIAILVWLDPVSREPSLALHELGQGALVSKISPPIVRRSSVGGAPALWTEGPYPLLTRDGSLQDLHLVPGRVLVWEAGGTTFRLETSLPLEQALRIAESLAPLR